MAVQCVKREQKIIESKGHGNSSSNFVIRLKLRHDPNAVEEYKNHFD